MNSSSDVRKKKVIIVDDDPAIRDASALIFKPAAYTVTVYPDATAILADRYELPDVFIVDKQLPGVDGLDLCRHIKTSEFSKGIPVIVMSASPSAAKQSQQAGADAFIEKPYSIRQLRELVQGLCS